MNATLRLAHRHTRTQRKHALAKVASARAMHVLSMRSAKKAISSVHVSNTARTASFTTPSAVHICAQIHAVYLSASPHRTQFYYFCDQSVREKAWRSRKRVAQAT